MNPNSRLGRRHACDDDGETEELRRIFLVPSMPMMAELCLYLASLVFRQEQDADQPLGSLYITGN